MTSEQSTDKAITGTSLTAVWADAVTTFKASVPESETWSDQTITNLKHGLAKKLNDIFSSESNINLVVDQMKVEPASENRFVVVSPVEDDGRLAIWNSVRSLKKDNKRLERETADLTQQKSDQSFKDAQLGSGLEILLKEMNARITAQEQRNLKQDQKIEEQDRTIQELQTDNKALKNDNKALQNDNKALKNDIRKISKALEDQQKEMDRKVDREAEDRMNRQFKDQKKDWENQKKDLEYQIKELKKESDDQKAKLEELTDRLEEVEEELANEKKERARVERELATEKKERQLDIAQITVKLMPIHLRILLDESRKKIIGILQPILMNSPDDVIYSQPHTLFRTLEASKKQGPLSELTVTFLWKKENVIREHGNRAAHQATSDEVYWSMKATVYWYGAEEQGFMKQLFEFCYGIAFDKYQPSRPRLY